MKDSHVIKTFKLHTYSTYEKRMMVPKVFSCFLETYKWTNGVQFICKQKAQSGIHGTFQLSSVQLRFFFGLLGPVWTSHKPVRYKLFLLLLLLPETLQQDPFVGGVKYSRLLQVFLCDVTGRKHTRDTFKTSNHVVKSHLYQCRGVPEELEVVPAIV